MADARIGELLELQHRLAVEKGWIADRVPEKGHMSLLWSIDELGEVIAILKKKGAAAVMENESVRAHFTEEIADVFMYLFDMMECYGITAEEFTEAYLAKFRRNLGRDWRENDAERNPVHMLCGIGIRQQDFSGGASSGIAHKDRPCTGSRSRCASGGSGCRRDRACLRYDNSCRIRAVTVFILRIGRTNGDPHGCGTVYPGF